MTTGILSGLNFFFVNNLVIEQLEYSVSYLSFVYQPVLIRTEGDLDSNRMKTIGSDLRENIIEHSKVSSFGFGRLLMY